jgi:hypothetical protein
LHSGLGADVSTSEAHAADDEPPPDMSSWRKKAPVEARTVLWETVAIQLTDRKLNLLRSEGGHRKSER